MSKFSLFKDTKENVILPGNKLKVVVSNFVIVSNDKR
jgi:hypothetical protein